MRKLAVPGQAYVASLLLASQRQVRMASLKQVVQGQGSSAWLLCQCLCTALPCLCLVREAGAWNHASFFLDTTSHPSHHLTLCCQDTWAKCSRVLACKPSCCAASACMTLCTVAGQHCLQCYVLQRMKLAAACTASTLILWV